MLKRVFVGYLVVGILLLLGAGACYITAFVTADTSWMDHSVNIVLGSLAVVGLGVMYALAIVAIQYLRLVSLSLRDRIELTRLENKRRKDEMQSNIELEKADRAAELSARLNAAKMTLASVGGASSQAEASAGLEETPDTTVAQAPEAPINSPASSCQPERRNENSRTACSEDQDALTMSAVYVMKGVQDLLEVYEDRVAITPKGVIAFLNKGLKGTKDIPFVSIVAVQFKEAGFWRGYLQFTIPGGNESRGGIFAAIRDENTFMFGEENGNNDMARKIKKYIDGAMRKSRLAQAGTRETSLANEIQKLAQLKESGALSEDEFQAGKRRLIG